VHPLTAIVFVTTKLFVCFYSPLFHSFRSSYTIVYPSFAFPLTDSCGPARFAAAALRFPTICSLHPDSHSVIRRDCVGSDPESILQAHPHPANASEARHSRNPAQSYTGA